jgi:LysR family transcriptional regulator, low CO2-responsive transcriptional regulator
VTLTQLKVFVLVARLGSVKAAAASLGVTEPAVSQALTALRHHFGDPLLERNGASMQLTAAGHRIIRMASQMVSLSVDAEAAAREGSNGPDLLRVVASGIIAESMGAALLQGFESRAGKIEITLGVASSLEMVALIHERLADVAIGPKPLNDTDGLEVSPLLRWRLVFVASADHPLSRRTATLADLAKAVWLTDPSGQDPASVVAQLVTQLRVPEGQVRVFTNQAAVLDAASRGAGLAPCVNQFLLDDLTSRNLARVVVEGLPSESQWFSTSLVTERRSVLASRFLRYLSTPDAHQLMRRPGDGVPAARFRPPVHVTIWS